MYEMSGAHRVTGVTQLCQGHTGGTQVLRGQGSARGAPIIPYGGTSKCQGAQEVLMGAQEVPGCTRSANGGTRSAGVHSQVPIGAQEVPVGAQEVPVGAQEVPGCSYLCCLTQLERHVSHLLRWHT